MITHVNEISFDKAIKIHKVCLVDFFATWCGPCRMLTAELEDATEQNSKLEVLKVDIDECYNLAEKFQIEVVPTMIIFVDGKPVKQLQGYLNSQELLRIVEPYLK